MTRIDEVIDVLRRTASSPVVHPETFTRWRDSLSIEGDPFHAAVVTGAQAGQLAFAFAGGYQAALRRVLPSLAPDSFAALLVSEGRHQHPADLKTVLRVDNDGVLQLHGDKSFVTGGEQADVLLVLARDETKPAADGKARGVLVRLAPNTFGITRTARTDIGILPALPHGRVNFDSVPVERDNLLPGDGWKDWARPFRTTEDIHVSAAIAAHIAVAAWRHGFPDTLLASVIAVLVRLADASTFEAADPRGHLLLGGADEEMLRIGTRVAELTDARDDDFSRDWRANRMVMALAVPARIKRLEQATAWLRGNSG